jgi:hypothetical protein
MLYLQKDRFDQKFFKKVTEQRRHHSFIRNLSRRFSQIVIAAASAGAVIQLFKSDEALPLLQLMGKAPVKVENPRNSP